MNEPTFYPELIRIDITSKCNLKCKHCQTGMFREPGSELSDLSTKEMQALFAQMSELVGCPSNILDTRLVLKR